jgi:hypothetical protein
MGGEEMIKGDTIQLRVHFKDFKGRSVDPENVTLTFYDKQQKQFEQFILDDTNRENVGVFYYDYVPASELDEFIFEFAGSYQNKPILARDSVKLSFI